MMLRSIRKCVDLIKVNRSLNLVSFESLRSVRQCFKMDSSSLTSTALPKENPEEKPMALPDEKSAVSPKKRSSGNLEEKPQAPSEVNPKDSSQGKSEKLALVSKKDIAEFDEHFTSLISDLSKSEKLLHQSTSRYRNSLTYNVPKGKRTRGLMVVAAYKLLEKPENLSEKNIFLANRLGWLVEMLQAFFLVMDDIVDGSEMRRGQLCWYKLKDIGLSAINDGLLLENNVFHVLKNNFRKHPCYLNFMETFLEITRRTIIGQIYDCQVTKINQFSMSRYDQIAYNKTAYYSFFLPVSLALYHAKITDPSIHNELKDVLLEIGKFFQVQDDYLDAFGRPEVTGKVGTDIETGKNTWLAVKLYELASPDDKNYLMQNYGQNDPKVVETVRKLYEDYGIPSVYKQYEEESYNTIKNKISDLSANAPKELLEKILAKIYRRNA